MHRSILQINLMSLILLGSTALFSMDNSNNALTILPLERRESVYKYLGDVGLCRYSQTSKDNHLEIYHFKQRDCGITQLKSDIKLFNSNLKTSGKTIWDNMPGTVQCSINEMAIAKKKELWMRMTKQPWAIKNT